jgi:Fe-S-cluster-containing hydrogenase component 2
MEEKKCNICNLVKPLSDFYKRKSNSPYDRCKECFNSYCTERWIQKKIDSIIYKGSECIICGLKYPNEPYVIFDFHHREPKDKEFNWNKLRLKSFESIKKELDKCDLLCSNCHRKKHFLVAPRGIEPRITL